MIKKGAIHPHFSNNILWMGSNVKDRNFKHLYLK